MSASRRRALSRLSRRSTPRNATRLPQSSEARWNTGSSTRHGPHQAAQTLMTTGWPRSSRTRASSALRLPGISSFAWRCTVASAGGAPSSFLRISWALSLLFPGWLGLLDSGAWPRPTATTTPIAASAAIARIHGSHRRIGERVSDAGTLASRQAASAVSCVALHGRGSTISGRSLPVPRRNRGAPSRQALLSAATLRFQTDSQAMAESTSAAAEAAAIPDQAAIERAEAFTRERFVHDGEDSAVALAPGSARRRALEDALRELDSGAGVPSTRWRRRYALLLGLERLLSDDERRLADGALLNPHQVDALSGTLTALLAAAQKGPPGAPRGAEPVLGVEEEAAPEPPPDAAADEPEDDERDDEDEEDEEEDETPEDSWDDEQEPDVDEDVEEGAADDPNAYKRFWFEHATGSGKTVAAMGFVEASRTGGILILTHRRNLVDQFIGEISDRGYRDRLSPPLLGHEDTANGPVTVETYQWFVRNAGNVSDAYSIVICDEAHTALGEKTSTAIREWREPVFVGMTAT